MEPVVVDVKHRVQYYETDKMGYVHNSNYFRFFEIGRTEFMRAYGVEYSVMEQEGVMMPLIEQHARYHTPALYDEVITIRTIVEKMPMSRIHFEYRILKTNANGKEVLVCEGWNELCFIDEETRKPLRCPLWVQEKLEKVLPIK